MMMRVIYDGQGLSNAFLLFNLAQQLLLQYVCDCVYRIDATACANNTKHTHTQCVCAEHIHISHGLSNP